MKYIAIIVLGLVLLAAIAGVVLWANMPTAKLTVHAARQIRTFHSLGVSPDPLEQRPVWDVAITNTGRAAVRWFPAFRIKDYNGTTHSTPGWACDPATGVLSAGQYTNVDVCIIRFTDIAPSNPVVAWAAGVEYMTGRSSLESRLDRWLKPAPKLRRLLPSNGPRYAYDAWHPMTNVAPAH